MRIDALDRNQISRWITEANTASERMANIWGRLCDIDLDESSELRELFTHRRHDLLSAYNDWANVLAHAAKRLASIDPSNG